MKITWQELGNPQEAGIIDMDGIGTVQVTTWDIDLARDVERSPVLVPNTSETDYRIGWTSSELNPQNAAEVQRIVEEQGLYTLYQFVGRLMSEHNRCSFCGVPRDKVDFFVALGCGTPYAFLCNGCLELGNQIAASRATAPTHN